MRKVLCILFLIAIVVGLAIRSHTQTAGTPGWLRFLGDGSDGPYSCSSGTTCILGDEHWFSSLNVASGATLVTTGGDGPIFIRSTGTCTIAGTMSDSPNTGAGLTIQGAGDFGGSGGGGGGGTGAGQSGFPTLAGANLVINPAGTAGTVGAGNGGNGSTPVEAQYRLLLGGGTFWPVGGGAGGPGGTNGGLGGTGGGPIILVCNAIDFTGTIDVSGGPGQASTGNNSGGGGGGGGGYVILSAVTYVANTGTIKTAGGTGGSCGSFSGCGAGGKGGDGWNVALTIQ
jgi:hypothetical protein